MPDRAEQYHIYKLLEPTDILRTGNHKQHKPIKQPLPHNKQLTNDEEGQDEYLKRHGIL